MTDQTITDDLRRRFCDVVLERATTMMQNEGKAPLGMILDRLLTFAAAQACAEEGSARAAEVFREIAAKIDAGLFHSVTGEGVRQ